MKMFPAIGLWLWVMTTALAQAADTSLPPTFHVGLARMCFRNINRNDAIAAFRIFLEAAGRHYGNEYRAQTQVFENNDEFQTALKQQPMEVAVMDAWQYLTMDYHHCLQPFFVVAENGKVGRRYLVLTRHDSGLDDLADLRDKSLVQIELASANVGKIWLDTELLTRGLGTQQTFFGSIEVAAKPATVVLPVFFGKKAACVVDEPSFEVMKELNPQVGRELQTIATSDTYADVVVCLGANPWSSEKLKRDTVQALTDLQDEPSGQQILMLFKIDRMVAFRDSQLDTVRALRSRYERLHKETLR